ncbi:gfo/Idh/MocA family oxidoreductase [bacterium]|nr:gfo/Idh/MocA family oxidoreductase [bacterium]
MTCGRCSDRLRNIEYSGAMDESPPLRLGIIGLGKLWETRHRPALERTRDKFRVVAVYDQVLERGRRTANQLRCDPAEGLKQIVEHPNIDAICLLAPQWFGTYPIELAAQRKLPVYSSVPIPTFDEARRIGEAIESNGIKFMPELARRQYPATRRLKELLTTKLGPVRMILGQTRVVAFDRYGQPGPTSQNAPVSLRSDPIYFLIDWARHVIGEEPVSVLQTDASIGMLDNPIEGDFHSIIMRYPSGAVAQMTCYRHHPAYWGDAARMPLGPGYQVFCERGMAYLEMPDLIRWHDNTGFHEERLPMQPSLGELLEGQFYRLVRDLPYEGPGIRDVLAITRVLDGHSGTH